MGFGYDVKCYDLAESFLEDEIGINSGKHMAALAQEVQDTIEDWISAQRAKENSNDAA